jgi:hypothetical protein
MAGAAVLVAALGFVLRRKWICKYGRKWFFWFGLGFEMGPFGISCPRVFDAFDGVLTRGLLQPKKYHAGGLESEVERVK